MGTKVEIVIGTRKFFVCHSGCPSSTLAEFKTEIEAKDYITKNNYVLTGIYSDND